MTLSAKPALPLETLLACPVPLTHSKFLGHLFASVSALIMQQTTILLRQPVLSAIQPVDLAMVRFNINVQPVLLAIMNSLSLHWDLLFIASQAVLLPTTSNLQLNVASACNIAKLVHKALHANFAHLLITYMRAFVWLPAHQASSLTPSLASVILVLTLTVTLVPIMLQSVNNAIPLLDISLSIIHALTVGSQEPRLLLSALNV